MSTKKDATTTAGILQNAAVPWQTKLHRVFQYLDEDGVKKLMSAILSADLSQDEMLRFATLIRQHKDDVLRFATLIRQHVYAEDLFATRAQADWLNDPHFQQAYEKAASISSWGTPIRWRCYTLAKAARLASRVEGNFVECGVSRGGTATCVINYLSPEDFSDRKFFLFDTFHGLEVSQMTTAETAKNRTPDGYYPEVLEEVKRNFKDCEFARIVPGVVPETLNAYDGGAVAFLHIDMNVSLTEIEAFRYFWPLLSPGGVVVFDDFGFPAHSEQQHALNKVAEELGTEIMMLPSGQGLTWKS